MAEIVAVIGLEVHVQLATKSKIFASDVNEFGAAPNTNIGPITMAHPGTLPLVNREVVDMAMRLGIAFNSKINRKLIFDRKNYFYPDLPKGYQITQDTTPICIGGSIEIDEIGTVPEGVTLTKIHLEEDAGKSIHVEGADYTNVDLNRAGVPLVEIVTDPVIKNSNQAALCLSEIQKVVRYLGISDGNMEEGSLRCDANISVHYEGTSLGSKVEVKNMNSIRNVRRAIDHEIERQTQLFKGKKEISSETRTYNPERNSTSSMRMKEELNDYRYFPEPDISPILINDEWFDEIKATMPSLPREVHVKLMEEYDLPAYDASFLSADRDMAEYYFSASKHTSAFKSLANWMMGVVQTTLKDASFQIDNFPVSPEKLAQLVNLVENKTVDQTAASQKLYKHLLQHPESDPAKMVDSLGIRLNDNLDHIQSLIDEVLIANPEKVKAYHNGKKGLTGMFMGEVMKKAKGGINAKEANKQIVASLNKMK